jgi:hypothetical protein
MTKKDLNELIQRASEWPLEAQGELLQTAHDIESRYYGLYVPDKEERAALKRSLDDVNNKRFATDDDVKKVFHNFHRA